MDRPNLNLTDDQKAQMKKIHEGAKSQIEAINNDSSLTADQKQAKIQAVRKDSHKQVEAMLTPEQRKTMREWRHEHRNERQQEPPIRETKSRIGRGNPKGRRTARPFFAACR